MVIVVYVSGVVFGFFIFMIIFLMFGFVKYINLERYFIFFFCLILLFQIVKGMIYQFLKYKIKKILFKCYKNKRKNCFKIFNYYIKYLKKMIIILFFFRVNKQLCGDVDFCKFECNVIL